MLHVLSPENLLCKVRKDTYNCLTESLACQKINPWFKCKERPCLEADRKISLPKADETELNLQMKRQFINTSRYAFTEHNDELQFTWGAANALITTRESPLKKSWISSSYPTFGYRIWYCILCITKFEDIQQQFKQEYFPVIADEGVFEIVTDIVSSHPKEFPKLFPMMGIFHMAKVALHCPGKYFKGSGIDTALVLSKAFGVNTVESVLSGGHYERSLIGMQVIKEVFELLKWEAFWKSRIGGNWEDIKVALKKLQRTFNSKNLDDSAAAYYDICSIIMPLMNEINMFTTECAERSNMCKYIIQGLEIINLIEMLIAADRDGNWELHVSVTEMLLPVFTEFDSINYLRHASWYVEKIKTLKAERRWLYDRFMDGHFVIKDKKGKFNSVSPDMKLEQTIQRAVKRCKWCCGSTKEGTFCCRMESDLSRSTHDKICFNDLTNSNLNDSRDTLMHHELIGTAKSRLFNNIIQRTLEIIQSQGNFFSLHSPPQLRNMLTQQHYEENLSQRIRNERRYGEFRNEHFRGFGMLCLMASEDMVIYEHFISEDSECYV